LLLSYSEWEYIVNPLERLYQFSSIITSTSDPVQLYRRIVESAREALGLDFSTLMLLSEDREQLIIHDTVGFPESMIGTFMLLEGQGLSTHVVKTRQAETVLDFEQERRFDIPPVVRQLHIRSALCVPMMIENEPFGVLIGHSLTMRDFSDQEQVVFQNMGNLAAVAIRNCLNMERLRKAKEFNETILNSMSDAIAIIQVPQMVVVEANQPFISQYGEGRREAVVGKLCHVVTHGSDRRCAAPNCACPAAETVSQQRTVLCEHKHLLGNGGTSYCEVVTTPIADESGRVTQVVHVQRDITERRRLERQLLQAQKMESVGRLAAGIAHDFNNILTAIIGYSQLLMASLPETAAEHEYSKVILDSGQRAASLVRQILAFSRQQTLDMRPVDINDSIHNLAKMLQRVIGEDVQLVLHTAAELPQVLADSGQIEQVITNLAVNARDAMPAGGMLVIETSLATIDAAQGGASDIPAGSYVAICVSDTGSGIPKEIIAKVFDPFFTTKELGKGTGLGLSTVYGIVKQHGGHLRVYSEEGEGATFRVFLPVSAGEKSEKPGMASGLSSGHGTATILVVDDDEPIRKVLIKYLTTLGYTMLEASGGNEALAVSAAHPGVIDILLTDVIMIEINGRELAQRMQQSRPGIKVIYMSGYPHNVIASHGVLEEGINFIDKPLRFGRLLEMLRKVAGSDPVL